MLASLFVAGVLALVGVVPALRLTWNEPAEVVSEASRIYVFERLPHHLALLRLAHDEIAQRLTRHAALLVVLGILTAVSGRISPAFARTIAAPVAPRRILYFAWGAALLAFAGFTLELLLWNEPLLAARLQRYYWYRLTDFAAPMAVAIWATAAISLGIDRRRTWGVVALAAALVFAGWHLATKAGARVLDPVPPADARLRNFSAWIDVCQWIAENTPAEAVFLTPRLNQTFKWRAGRAEVVTRKDIPQDAQSIVEWHRRIQEIYYYQDEDGELAPIRSLGRLGTERLRELALCYGAEYVLSERHPRVALPVVYWNEEYVVYRIED
jgi:hypothetical protein